MISLSVSVCDILSATDDIALRVTGCSTLRSALHQLCHKENMFKILVLTSLVLAHTVLSIPTSDTKAIRSGEDVVDLPSVPGEPLVNPDISSLENSLRSLIASVKQSLPIVRTFPTYMDVGAPPSGYKRVSSSSSFVPWAGKRTMRAEDKRFQAWAGKRGDKSFRSWSGKRALDPDYLYHDM